MAHEIAKLLLEHAQTSLEREEAIRTALSMGMPISAIREYLDWLDLFRSQNPSWQPPDPPPKQDD